YPEQAAGGAGELPGEDHLHHHVAAKATPLLRDADAEEALLGDLVPQGEGIVFLVLFQFPHPVLRALGIHPAANDIAARALVVGQCSMHGWSSSRLGGGPARAAARGLLSIAV